MRSRRPTHARRLPGYDQGWSCGTGAGAVTSDCAAPIATLECGALVAGRFCVEQELPGRASGHREYLGHDTLERAQVSIEVRRPSDTQASAPHPAILFQGPSPDGQSLLCVRALSLEEVNERIRELLGIRSDLFPDAVQPDSSSAHTLEQGETFAGRYVVHEALGRGATAAVYRATDTVLERVIALKILHDVALQEPYKAQAQGLVLQEARVMTKLRHRNVVELLETNLHEGTLYLGLELCSGGNLRSASLNATVDQKVAWLVQVGTGLGYAHSEGVLHRDVKPENIVISEHGVAKLTDFGIARALAPTDGQAMTASRGTPRYMAPEQITGEALDARADIYAWGLVAYETLTGMILLPGGSPDPELLRSVGVEESFVAVVLRSLQRNRDDRFPSMTEALTACTTKTGRRARRWRTGLVLLGAAGTLAIAITAIALVGKQRVQGAPRRPSVAQDIDLVPADAADAYRRATQAWLDASSPAAYLACDQAIHAAPHWPAAHLLYVVVGIFGLDEEERQHFTEATSRRYGLAPYEQQLLDALAPTFEIPSRMSATVERLQELVHQVPEQPLAWGALTKTLIKLGRFEEAIAASRAFHASNANATVALMDRGIAYADSDPPREPEAVEAFRECAAASSRAATCISLLQAEASLGGRCEDAERLARSWLAIDARASHAYYALANALFARGAPRETVKTILEQGWREQEDHGRQSVLVLSRARYALAFGDFSGALAEIEKARSAMKGSSDETLHAEQLTLEAEILFDLGRSSEAGKLATEFLERRATWLSSRLDSSYEVDALAIQRRAGAISAAEFHNRRDAWLASVAEKESGSAAFARQRWFRAFAASALTKDEAVEALERVRWAPPTRDAFSRDDEEEVAAARLLVLAGRPEAALPRLEVATRSCSRLEHPLVDAQARVLLARQLAPRGSVNRACALVAPIANSDGWDRRSRVRQEALQLHEKFCSQTAQERQ